MLKTLMTSNITSLLTQNEENLAFETQFSELDMMLLLTRGVHFEAKKLLK